MQHRNLVLAAAVIAAAFAAPAVASAQELEKSSIAVTPKQAITLEKGVIGPTEGLVVHAHPLIPLTTSTGPVTSVIAYEAPTPTDTIAPQHESPSSPPKGAPGGDPSDDGDAEERMREQQEAFDRMMEIINDMNRNRQENTRRITGG